jgi:hypothetical protein
MEAKKPKKVIDKAATFKKLAEFRLNKAVKYIRALAHLSNVQAYTFTPDQVNKLFSSLQAEIVSVKETFAKGGKSTNAYTL